MALRKIITEEDPILRKKSKVVTVFDANLKELFKDMLDTVNKAQGAGISAVQVGILKRMFIIFDHKDPVFIVNPELIKYSGINKITMEGCLSLPGKWGDVERPNKVWVKYQDQDGNIVENKFTGFVAKAFCHEYDHLDGILYVDKADKLFNSYEEYIKYKKSQNKADDKK